MGLLIKLFVFFNFVISISSQQIQCRVNATSNGSSGYFDFSSLMKYNYLGSYNDSSNSVVFDFIFQLCGGLQLTYADIAPDLAGGWFFGTLQTFNQTNGGTGQPSYVQTYTNGDRGYPCITGRYTNVNIYCVKCPVPNSCNGSNTDCVCSGDYSFNVDERPNICMASINVAINSCPTFTSYSPTGSPSNKLSGSQIFGIFLLVFFIMVSVVCVGGYAYNYKVYDRRGKEAIPGYLFIKRERAGMEKFSGSAYQRTPVDPAQYGTL